MPPLLGYDTMVRSDSVSYTIFMEQPVLRSRTQVISSVLLNFSGAHSMCIFGAVSCPISPARGGRELAQPERYFYLGPSPTSVRPRRRPSRGDQNRFRDGRRSVLSGTGRVSRRHRAGTAAAAWSSK